MWINVSMLDRRVGLDITVGIALPDEALGAVRGIIRDVVKREADLTLRTGYLIRMLLSVAAESGLQRTLKVSSRPDYAEYVMTVSFEGKRVCIQDFRCNGNVHYVDFTDLDAWFASP
jgi:hypothetical protein